MDSKVETVTLTTLARGGVMERFEDAMQQAVSNIMDPNTTLAKREITIRVIMKPNEARDFCETQIHLHTKLGAPKPIATQIYVGLDPQHGPVAMEHNPQQLVMGFGSKAADKIAMDIKSGKEEPLDQGSD